MWKKAEPHIIVVYLTQQTDQQNPAMEESSEGMCTADVLMKLWRESREGPQLL